MGAFKNLAVEASFLLHYLQFFGDNQFKILELIPSQDSAYYDRRHLEVAKHGIEVLEGEPQIEDIDSHPCWCNAELIYADDIRGNEVWLHKRVQ